MTATAFSEPFLFTPGPSDGQSRSGQGAIGAANPANRNARGNEDPAETLIDQARQEISAIVREVASAARTHQGRDPYLRFLADRILRAMAAHGVVIWSVEDAASDLADWRYVVEHRLGTVTDHGLDETGRSVHDGLLIEVAGQHSPVVVPATPGASDVNVPANPTSHPAALVPVSIDPDSPLPNCLIEVFLEPGGSPASQRGSLRFLAQMADLAGEFLRAEHLRSLTRRLSQMNQCARAVDRLQTLSATTQVEAAWVDATAELLECPRVALCRVDEGRPRIVAVSHVDRIDQSSEAAQAIREAATSTMRSKGSLALAVVSIAESPRNALGNDQEIQGQNSAIERRKADRRTSQADHHPVRPHWVVSLQGDSRWRMVLLQRQGDSLLTKEPDQETTAVLERVLVGGQLAWAAADRVEAIPGGKWWNRLTAVPPPVNRPGASSGEVVASALLPAASVSPVRRRIALFTAMAMSAALLLWVPIPSVISVTGVIRPLELDTYHTRHDATVQTIHVDHGQTVRQGDLLATLWSGDLSQKQTSLLGRRAVLVQKRDQVNRKLIASNGSVDGSAGLPGSDEIDEEIMSIDEQLKIISQSQDDLVLRARRDGRVDAWRVHERLSDRPLRRGDAVLSVIATDTTWVADATIPQRRVQRIDQAIQHQRLSAEVAPRWSADQSQTATAHRFGPVVTDPVDGTPGVILRLTLAQTPRLGNQPLVETPARITVDCGRTSVGSFLFEDVMGWFKTRVGMYR